MKKVCFKLKLEKNNMDEYLENHQVWPEMLEEMSKSGLRNYSLFIDKKEGAIIGYFESDDPQQSLKTLGETEVNQRWQKNMSKYFQSGSGDMQTGQIEWLEQYFYLE